MIRSLLLNERKDVTIPFRSLTQQVTANHRESTEIICSKEDGITVMETSQATNGDKQEKCEAASPSLSNENIQSGTTDTDTSKQMRLPIEGANSMDGATYSKKRVRSDSESSNLSFTSGSSNDSSSSDTSSADDNSDDSSSSSSSMSEMES